MACIPLFRCLKIPGEVGKQEILQQSSETSRSQIVCRTDIFGKLMLGAPDYRYSMLEKCFAVFEWIWYPFEQLGVSVPKIVIHSNGLGYLFGKNYRPFEQRRLSVPKKSVICLNGLGCPFGKNCDLFEWLGISISKNCYPFGWLGLSV